MAVLSRANVLNQEALDAGDDADPSSRLRIYESGFAVAAGQALIANKIQGFVSYLPISLEVLREGFPAWVLFSQQYRKLSKIAPTAATSANCLVMAVFAVVYSRFQFISDFDLLKLIADEGKSLAEGKALLENSIQTYNFASMHVELKVFRSVR